MEAVHTDFVTLLVVAFPVLFERNEFVGLAKEIRLSPGDTNFPA
jgi:hypothetical protein